MLCSSNDRATIGRASRSIALLVGFLSVSLLAAVPGFGPTGAGAAGGVVTASVAPGWSAKPIAAGIKPVLALDGKGAPAVAYLEEKLSGSVAFASSASSWRPETVARGYFYGPIGLAFDRQGRANVVYHDHQGQEVDLGRGALVYALREGTRWRLQPVPKTGHDGWDSTIAIGPDGVVRAAGILPSQFNYREGVDYYELSKGSWTVTPIGSGPIAYEFNVSLAVNPKSGRPALTYYNDRSGDLVFASFDGRRWMLETVVSRGDAGKFSSLQLDSRGRPHISFFQQTSSTSGTVRYAVRDGGSWKVEEVGRVTDVGLGMTGARRSSALALDAQGVPRVAFSDRKVLRYATRTASGWKVETVVTARTRPLGQLVSLALDRAGKPHLAFFEVTGTSPMLAGEVVYLTRK